MSVVAAGADSQTRFPLLDNDQRAIASPLPADIRPIGSASPHRSFVLATHNTCAERGMSYWQPGSTDREIAVSRNGTIFGKLTITSQGTDCLIEGRPYAGSQVGAFSEFLVQVGKAAKLRVTLAAAQHPELQLKG